jgi:lipopolysaccharide assembly protein A
VAVSLSRDDEPDARTDDAAPANAALDAEGDSLERDVDEVERGRPERAFNVGVTVGIVVTVAAVIFVLQNRQSTTFDWLWLDFELPLWIALLGAVGVGVVLVLTVLAVHARRRRRVRRRRDAAGRLRRAVARDRPQADPGR